MRKLIRKPQMRAFQLAWVLIIQFDCVELNLASSMISYIFWIHYFGFNVINECMLFGIHSQIFRNYCVYFSFAAFFEFHCYFLFPSVFIHEIFSCSFSEKIFSLGRKFSAFSLIFSLCSFPLVGVIKFLLRSCCKHLLMLLKIFLMNHFINFCFFFMLLYIV